MPFPMVHFFVANALSITKEIDDLPQFFLGILAPDAIHTRKEISFEDRKTSHLAIDEPTLWQKEIIRFMKHHKHDNQKWFYMGYGVHILTDIYWDKMIYRPFLLAYSQDREASGSGQRQAYVSDMTLIDLWLYRNCEFKNDLWAYLSEGKSVDIQGLVTAAEIDGERDRTLVWYDERKDQTIDHFKYVKPEQITKFMQEVSKDIDDQLSHI